LLFRVTARLNKQGKRFDQLIEALALAEFRQVIEKDRFAKKILVVIPAYNEAQNIAKVLQKMPKEIMGYQVEPLVADDGSQDNTEVLVQHLGFPVISNKINRGQGGALKLGYLVAQSEGAEIVVTMDADGQHDPVEIESLVAPIIRREADFVNGSRTLGKQLGGGTMRKIGNFLLNIIFIIMLRRKITDCTSGFRAIRTNLLSTFDLREQQFQSSEPLIEAIRHGARLKEVPITILPRQGGETKKPRDLTYGLKWFWAMLRAWWR
jgi:glycosyltransferase involved in cell wall biosynthesis